MCTNDASKQGKLSLFCVQCTVTGASLLYFLPAVHVLSQLSLEE